MNAELDVPVALALPRAGWTDALVRRYVRALVTYHEELVAEKGPDAFLCDRLERLLGIRGGVR